MRTLSTHRLFVVIVLALATPVAIAAGSYGDDSKGPVATMAGILLGLNHYPSTAEKEQLEAISNDAGNSRAVQVIAMAIHDMQHSVSAADKGQLQAIVESKDVDSREKDLAEILLGITHYPGSEAKARLKKLMK